MRKFPRTQIREVIVNDHEVRLDTLCRLYCAPPSADGEDFTFELKLQCRVQKFEKFRIVCDNQDRWMSHLDRSHGHVFIPTHCLPPLEQQTHKELSDSRLQDR